MSVARTQAGLLLSFDMLLAGIPPVFFGFTKLFAAIMFGQQRVLGSPESKILNRSKDKQAPCHLPSSVLLLSKTGSLELKPALIPRTALNRRRATSESQVAKQSKKWCCPVLRN
jgi:hypothetical protein